MLRCITEEKKSLIASSCDPKLTRELSRAHKLFCPNCNGIVRYNKGNVKSSYFSHVNLECEYIGSEPETPSHIKGKELLYDWLKNKFPIAYVEYEKHIPETGQIVDVYIRHNDGELDGKIWAFEFQHSNISSEAWKERHELYKSVGIQDFWILDKTKFLKFSSAKGATNARLRKDLEKKIFEETRLCYFLDLETSEMTIDFNFRTETSYVDIGRGKSVPQSLIFHEPEKHSAQLSNIRTRINKEFNYCVLISDDFEKDMKNSLLYILEKLKQDEKDRKKKELNKRARELITLAKEDFGDEFADRFREIIKVSNEELELRDDLLTLDNSELFVKYKSIVETSISNSKEYDSLKNSTELVPRYLLKKAYPGQFKMVRYLKEQRSLPLDEYLMLKYSEKIALVQYVYDNYKSSLEFLTTRNKDWINEKLGEINWELKTYVKKPDVIDYAIQYSELNSIQEVDDNIQQIDEKIINFKPTFDPKEWDFDLDID